MSNNIEVIKALQPYFSIHRIIFLSTLTLGALLIIFKMKSNSKKKSK